MTHKTQNKQPLKIAAPYYGALSHPTRGLSNLYFLLDINPAEKKVAHMHISVWDPAEESRLGIWLDKLGVKTLVCNYADDCHIEELNAMGVQIQEVDRSDILTGINKWLSCIDTLPACI